MLNLLHRIAENGRVYDWIQNAAGARIGYQHIFDFIKEQRNRAWVLDVGGGTGRTGRYRKQWRYVCFDLEHPKLLRVRYTTPDGIPVQGDATKMPFASGSVDLALCIAVAHHLTDPMLDEALLEIRRVLHPNGQFVFLDPIYDATVFRGRLLWSLDRGSFPRSSDQLEAAISRHFTIRQQEIFTIHHRYVLLDCIHS